MQKIKQWKANTFPTGSYLMQGKTLHFGGDSQVNPLCDILKKTLAKSEVPGEAVILPK